LGNFCFGGNKNPKNKETMIFQKTFTFVDGELQLDDNIQIIPCYISSVKNRNNFQPTPAEGQEAKEIIDHINQYSKGFGVKFDYDGKLCEEE
ncbi:MAG: CapA family protein, partial [Lachnospiraceae bacterium]|nr:CapA family protein [Lachnospiraceae bacterium]